MIPNQYFNISAQQVVLNGTGVKKLEGYIRTASPATQDWLQVFDVKVAPTTGDVPIKSFPVYGGAEFFKEFELGELRFYKGLYVGLSTTEGTWTASADVMDLYVETTDIDIPTGTTVTTGTATYFNPWLEAGGPKTLYAVKVTNKEAGVRYLQMFGIDSPTTGDVPITQWALNATGVSGLVNTPQSGDTDQLYLIDNVHINFGVARGLTPQQQVNGVTKVGCFFGLSTVGGTWQAAIGSGMDYAVQFK